MTIYPETHNANQKEQHSVLSQRSINQRDTEMNFLADGNGSEAAKKTENAIF